ncbi:MAG: hypothetical protein V8R75_08680 [Oscillospiraceae bacterium]
MVLFGNRSYDNALAELWSVLMNNGFHPVAAGAFVGRHAFTDKLGEGRPDWDDKRQMRQFAAQIAGKLRSGRGETVAVPGVPDAPYYIPKGGGRRAGEISTGQTPDRPGKVYELRGLCPIVSYGGD